jgi:hypothetical protein
MLGTVDRLQVFTGKQTKEKTIWHGPFVCASKQQLMGVRTQAIHSLL